MGNTTDKIKEGIKDTAGAVKRGAEKAKDAAVRGVDKRRADRREGQGQNGPRRREGQGGPEQAQPQQDSRQGRVRHVQTPGEKPSQRGEARACGGGR